MSNLSYFTWHFLLNSVDNIAKVTINELCFAQIALAHMIHMEIK